MLSSPFIDGKFYLILQKYMTYNEKGKKIEKKSKFALAIELQIESFVQLIR